MAINIFSIDTGIGNDPRMFFDLNAQEYNYYTDPTSLSSYDIVNVINAEHAGPEPASRLRIELAIWHNHENQSRFGYQTAPTATRSSSNTVIITNAYDPINDHHQWVINNDFLFNRTKAYYLDYPWRPETKRWYYHGPEAFVLEDIPTAENKQKIYVAPNNTKGSFTFRKIKYRPQLVQLLKINYRDLGYIGNYDDDKNFFLYAHYQIPNCHSIEELENMQIPNGYGTMGYTPPHNEYYKNTFISIYGETIEFGPTHAITEKTYDPLIKGHFILPFSAPGFLDRVRLMGFKLPDFIDYGYDTIQDDDQRWTAYADEVRRLLSMSLDQWRQHWTDDLDLIRHNRQVFFTKDYDRVDLTKYFG